MSGPDAAPASRSVLELLALSAGYLKDRGVPSPRREADALLAHVLGCDRLGLYLRFEERPTGEQVARLRALLRRRGEREPLQYLTGRCAFLDLELACDRRALIPRPETEELARAAADLPGVAGGSCLDVGTGTGCLALALARRGARVLATDVSAGALDLARENARALGLEGAVRFALGPLYDPVGAETGFALVVSNPPYVPEGLRGSLQPEVGLHEPAGALFAGPEGLDALLPILDGAPARLAAGGHLALECDPSQAGTLLRRAQASGAWAEARVAKDAFGRDRFVFCRVG